MFEIALNIASALFIVFVVLSICGFFAEVNKKPVIYGRNAPIEHPIGGHKFHD